MSKIIRFFNFLEELPIIGLVFMKLHYPVARIMYYLFVGEKSRKSWEIRIQDVVAAPDNKHIPRVDYAGQIIDGYLIMHNGIKVVPGSYYGEGMRSMLEKNGGVHEPQEEYAFMQVLKHMPEGAIMLELGAYWGFYSMWFHKMVNNPRCLLVEPQINNLRNGKKNFAVNNFKGEFIRGNIGAVSENKHFGAPLLTVDKIVKENKLKHIHILHADIQGYELDMLKGASNTIEEQRIDYIFISSHSDNLHRDCISLLKNRGFSILAEANLEESYSCDGLIVARRSDIEGIESISISKKGAQSMVRF